MFERVLLPAKLESELNAHFERTCDHFAALKTKAPEAIVLGGGYGRGEGGVTEDSKGQPRFLMIWTIFSLRTRLKMKDWLLLCMSGNSPKVPGWGLMSKASAFPKVIFGRRGNP